MVASHYVQRGSKVRCTLLDMSKAFDMADHGHLFDLLLQRKRPYPVIRFLIQWYSQQWLNPMERHPFHFLYNLQMVYGRVGYCPLSCLLYTLTSLCSNCRVLASVVTGKNCLLVAYAIQMILLYFPLQLLHLEEC